MIIALLIFFAIFFTYMILLVLIALWKKDQEPVGFRSYPFVSILIAARNEEKNILDCLQSLSQLDYPKDKIEVLIGNDNSEDKTEVLVSEYIVGKDNFRLVNIFETLGCARGKANVLAHLAKAALGDFFLITDADIEVPSSWVNGLIFQYKQDCGIVSGVTVVDGKGIFAKLQSLEWLYAFGMIKAVSDLKIPVSAVGNNMLISRKAYESTGGYENIPFSVTEDHELFRQTLKKGWDFKNLLNREVLAFSRPVSICELFNQRKRWMSGAWKLPLVLVICLLFQSLFFLAIIISVIINPFIGGLVWVSKAFLQQLFIFFQARKLNWGKELIKYFFLFELYSGILSVLLLIYYVIPNGISWKGRKY